MKDSSDMSDAELLLISLKAAVEAYERCPEDVGMQQAVRRDLRAVARACKIPVTGKD